MKYIQGNDNNLRYFKAPPTVYFGVIAVVSFVAAKKYAFIF